VEVWDASSSSSERREGDPIVVMEDISAEGCGVVSCVGVINCEVLGGGGGSGVVWIGGVLGVFNVGVVTMCGGSSVLVGVFIVVVG
jgi:hypothetical protein